MAKFDLDDITQREGSESLINSAALDAIRRSKLQAAASSYLITPLTFSQEDKSYHYVLAFNSMCQLFCEISPKLSQKEIDSIIKGQEEIQEMIDKNNIFKSRFDYSRVVGTILMQENWKQLRKKLWDFNLSIKRLVDARGFGSPDKADPRKAVLNM